MYLNSSFHNPIIKDMNEENPTDLPYWNKGSLIFFFFYTEKGSLIFILWLLHIIIFN